MTPVEISPHSSSDSDSDSTKKLVDGGDPTRDMAAPVDPGPPLAQWHEQSQ